MSRKASFILVTALACLVPLQADAALFEDKDARRSIIDLRTRVNNKADASALVELSRQNDMLRHEVARLRGMVEVLTNEFKGLQHRQRELYMDLDRRVSQFEPRQIVVEGKSFVIAPEEQKAFDGAEAAFAAGNYKDAITAYNAFLRRYPQSGLAVAARFALGNAYFMQKDFKNAISTQTALIKQHPDSEKVPEAMLGMANSHIGLKEFWSAKRTLNQIIEKYPDSDAARQAKQRLQQLG